MTILNDDYAIIEWNNGNFYYGYECCLNPSAEGQSERVWCFQATIDGQKSDPIPWTELGTDSMYDIFGNLAAGIAKTMPILVESRTKVQ